MHRHRAAAGHEVMSIANIVRTRSDTWCIRTVLLVLLSVPTAAPTAAPSTQRFGNLTAAEIAFADSIGTVQEVVDTTTLSGLGREPGSWVGIAYAPTTRKLYCPPAGARSVLMIDPMSNTTDIDTLGGLSSDPLKWRGIDFAPNTGKLYAAPARADAVLIVDPVFNTTDTTTLIVLAGGIDKWEGIVFAPNTQKLYATPHDSSVCLVLDPVTNTTDTTAITNLGAQRSKWHGMAFATVTGKLYAAPYNSDAVLVVNPMSNTSDITTMGGFRVGGYKWLGIDYANSVNKLYASPNHATGVLVIDPVTNSTSTIGFSYHSSFPGYHSIAFNPVFNKLHAAPWQKSRSVLTLDPETNATSFTPTGSRGWFGIAFAPTVTKLYGVGSSDSIVILGFTVAMFAPTATPTLVPSSPPTSSSTLPNDISGDGGDNSMIGTIVGIIIAVLAVLVCGIYIVKWVSDQRHHVPLAAPQSDTVDMFTNPLHSEHQKPASSDKDYSDDVNNSKVDGKSVQLNLAHLDPSAIYLDSENYVTSPLPSAIYACPDELTFDDYHCIEHTGDTQA